MRAVLVVFAAFVAVSAAYVVNDASFGIHTAIPGLSGAALTFNPAGDLFVYDSSHFSGCLFKFPNAANTPPFTQIPFSYGASCTASGGLNVGLGFAAIISTDTGRLYLSNGMEINPATGAVVRRAFQNCNAQHGIARDPRDGAIFFSDYSGRKIYRVENPDVHPEIQNPCATPFANTGADANTGIDGLTVGPDGLVYMAGYDASAFLVYSAYSAATPTGTKIGQTSTGRSAGSGPDGISICFGDGVSFAITADAGAHLLHRFNLTGPGGAPAYAVSTIVSGTGGYNDWTAVDTKGCIWGSTLDGTPGVFRLSNADGSCMQCATPQAPADGCNCQEVVNVQQGATTATASSNGACVAMHFQ